MAAATVTRADTTILWVRFLDMPTKLLIALRYHSLTTACTCYHHRDRNDLAALVVASVFPAASRAFTVHR